jgi:hypothetical protein
MKKEGIERAVIHNNLHQNIATRYCNFNVATTFQYKTRIHIWSFVIILMKNEFPLYKEASGTALLKRDAS